MYNFRPPFPTPPIFSKINSNMYSNFKTYNNFGVNRKNFSQKKYGNNINFNKQVNDFNNMHMFSQINNSKDENFQIKNSKIDDSKIEDFQNKVLFEIFGLKIFFDDLLIICILLFLYQEGIQDEYLFISLILLLLS